MPQLRSASIHVQVDLSSNTLNKKIRSAQLAQFNYILVVGKEEAAHETVNVRTRDNVVHGEMSVSALLLDLHAQIKDYR